MTADSYGKNQYISVRGLDDALKLIRSLAEVNPDYQFLLQLDDSDIWIVSWAARDFKFGGERFVHMTDFEYDEYEASKPIPDEEEL